MTAGLASAPRSILRTAHAYARDAVRLAILRGDVPAGSRLIQADLARELGVSTTPVREALRDLATEGLVDFDAHRGAVVRRLSTEDFIEIHELMRLLDPEAMRLAASIATEDRDQGRLEEAEALIERMEQEADVGAWVMMNLRFHELLVADVRRPRLLGMLAGLRDTVAPYTALALHQPGYPIATANRHHRVLLDAVRRGDPATAADTSAAHVDLTLQGLERAQVASAPGDR